MALAYSTNLRNARLDAIVAANEAIRAAIAAAQQEELPRLVWESVQQDEAAIVALIAELV